MSAVLLHGPPQSGKTHIVLAVVSALRSRGVGVAGFVTTEERQGGRRVAFTVQGVGGARHRFAVKHGPGVAWDRYGVDVEGFEGVALPELEAGLEGADVVVMDELGAMELLSERLRRLVPTVLERTRVLATGPEPENEVTASLRSRPDSRAVYVSGRDDASVPSTVDRLVEWLSE